MSRRRLPALGIALMLALSTSAVATSSDRAKLLSKLEALRNQVSAAEAEYLAPTKQDRAAHARFLAEPDTGLFRLLPRPRTEALAKVSIRGNGAYYSFTRLTHEYGYGSDILLEQGRFSVGFAGANYGMLGDLGDTPLEAVAVDAPGVRFLADWATPSRIEEARERQRESSAGLVDAGIALARSVPAVAGHAYVLRSVDFGTSDVLVALRVERADDDGSLIVAWKLLKRFPVPELVRDPSSETE
jgi:hypothetical protein